MVKFMILFQKPPDTGVFENVYNDFLALVERMPSITRRQVTDVLGSPTGEARYYRILELYFDDEAAMRAALTSKAGQEAGGELARFPRGSVETIFADVYEEAGGRTQTGSSYAGT